MCKLSLHCLPSLSVFHVSQAAELAPALQTDMEVKEAIQGAIQGENGEVVQIVTSVATWEQLTALSLQHGLTRLSGTAEVNKCIQSDKQSSQNYYYFFNKYWTSLMKWREEAFFSFCFVLFFSAKLLNPLPTRCRNVEMFTENSRRPWYFKINCGLSGVFLTRTTWPAAEYTVGLLSIQGGCCLCSPSFCHFINTHLFTSTLENSRYLELSCLAETLMRVFKKEKKKNLWIPLQTTRTVLLLTIFCHYLLWRTAVESTFSWGQLHLVVINVTLCELVHTVSPGYEPYLPLFRSSCFHISLAAQLCFVFLIYLIVICRNFWGALISEVEDR